MNLTMYVPVYKIQMSFRYILSSYYVLFSSLLQTMIKKAFFFLQERPKLSCLSEVLVFILHERREC